MQTELSKKYGFILTGNTQVKILEIFLHLNLRYTYASKYIELLIKYLK